MGVTVVSPLLLGPCESGFCRPWLVVLVTVLSVEVKQGRAYTKALLYASIIFEITDDLPSSAQRPASYGLETPAGELNPK